MTYKLEVTPEELGLLAAGLNELPRKVVQELFVKLQGQVAEQNRAAEVEKHEAAEAQKPKPEPPKPRISRIG